MQGSKELSIKSETMSTEGSSINGLAAIAIIIGAMYLYGGKNGGSFPDSTGSRVAACLFACDSKSLSFFSYVVGVSRSATAQGGLLPLRPVVDVEPDSYNTQVR